MFLATQRVHDRRGGGIGELHHRVMRAGTAAAAQHRDGGIAPEQPGEPIEIGIGR